MEQVRSSFKSRMSDSRPSQEFHYHDTRGVRDRGRSVDQNDTLRLTTVTQYKSVAHSMSKRGFMVDLNLKVFNDELTTAQPRSPRPPIQLVVLFDKSDFFVPERLQACRKSLEFAIGELKEGDRFAFHVVGPNTGASTVLSWWQMNEHGKGLARQELEEFELHPSTSVSPGMEFGALCVSSIKQLIRKSQSHTAGPNPTLTALLLVTDLSRPLRDESGTDVISQIRALASSSNDLIIYTFGLGQQHDPQPLLEIANACRNRGTYFCICSSRDIDVAFADVVGGLVSTVARQLVIEIKVQEPHRISKVMTKRSAKDIVHGKICSVYFGDVQAGEERDLLLQIDIDATPWAMPTQALVSVDVTYIDAANLRECKLHATAQIARTTVGTASGMADSAVIVQSGRSIVANAIQKADHLARNRTTQEARLVLRSAVGQLRAFLSSLPGPQREVCEGYISDLEGAYACLGSPQDYMTRGRYLMVQQAQRHFYQRSNSVLGSLAQKEQSLPRPKNANESDLVWGGVALPTAAVQSVIVTTEDGRGVASTLPIAPVSIIGQTTSMNGAIDCETGVEDLGLQMGCDSPDSCPYRETCKYTTNTKRNLVKKVLGNVDGNGSSLNSSSGPITIEYGGSAAYHELYPQEAITVPEGTIEPEFIVECVGNVCYPVPVSRRNSPSSTLSTIAVSVQPVRYGQGTFAYQEPPATTGGTATLTASFSPAQAKGQQTVVRSRARSSPEENANSYSRERHNSTPLEDYNGSRQVTVRSATAAHLDIEDSVSSPLQGRGVKLPESTTSRRRPRSPPLDIRIATSSHSHATRSPTYGPISVRGREEMKGDGRNGRIESFLSSPSDSSLPRRQIDATQSFPSYSRHLGSPRRHFLSSSSEIRASEYHNRRRDDSEILPPEALDMKDLVHSFDSSSLHSMRRHIFTQESFKSMRRSYSRSLDDNADLNG